MGKNVKDNQQYDNYWKITVEYSDIHGVLFSSILKLIVDFIDSNNLANVECTQEQNKQLQELVNKVNPKKDMGSVRKSINQFIKLGFVKPGYRGYHELTKKFIKSIDYEERELLFTQIFYEAGSLNSSYANDNTDAKEINFLLKTLAYNGKLTKNDLMGLMVTDVLKFPRGYMFLHELEVQYQYALSIKFDENKYNQIEYLIGFLKYMPGLLYENGVLKFLDNESVVVGNNVVTMKRDPILMRIYRKKLFNESSHVYNRIVCYACKLPWKGLVASHIKPLSDCLREQKPMDAYDKDNGLLLSPNIDAYFDKFDITFDEFGKILIGKSVGNEIACLLEGYQLDEEIMTSKRMKFMEYHRQIFEQKNK